MIKYCILVTVFLSLFFISCSNSNNSAEKRVVIGVSSDIGNFNPLFAFSVNEGNISELLYLSLVKHEWDKEKSDINTYPMLAEKWEWSNDSTSVIFYLRDDVKWSDGKKVTPEDVIFSFDIYSDPLVQSRLYGTFSSFITDTSNHIIQDKTFKVLSDNRLLINFLPGSKPTLFNVDLPVIPKHIFENIDRKNIGSAKELFTAVTDGPFLLKEWKKNQYILLAKNPDCFINSENTIKEIVFKVVPDYISRINQLKKGEIDILEEVKSDDVKDLKNNSNLLVASVIGREYDYIGWNNIDPEAYNKNHKLTSHKLFGSANIRKALTYAINRKEIIDEYLGGYAQICDVPLPPVMNELFNKDIAGYEYNPAKARDMLKKEGWADSDNDNVLEKNGTKFSFRLFIPGGNPRRSFVAAIVKNNLKAVGIEVTIETRELGHLIDNLFSKKLDSWIVSLYMPVPPDMKSCWYSDLKLANLNFANYQSSKADILINEIEKTGSAVQKNSLYRQFQQVIHEDQPVSFLYWVDNIVVYNKKINKIKVDPLGVIQKCWEWSI